MIRPLGILTPEGADSMADPGATNAEDPVCCDILWLYSLHPQSLCVCRCGRFSRCSLAAKVPSLEGCKLDFEAKCIKTPNFIHPQMLDLDGILMPLDVLYSGLSA
eukprot:scaffold21788_cov31-Tisochrysis_lutea.AAC.5